MVSHRGNGRPVSIHRGSAACIVICGNRLCGATRLHRRLGTSNFRFENRDSARIILGSCVGCNTSYYGGLGKVFTFTVCGADSGSLFLYESEVNIGPLFCCRCGNNLLFTSRVGTLLTDGVMGPRVSRRKLGRVFFLKPTEAPSFKIFGKMFRLGPNRYTVCERSGLHQGGCCAIRTGRRASGRMAAVRGAECLLASTVRQRLIDSIPLYFFLSKKLSDDVVIGATSVCGGRRGLNGVGACSIRCHSGRGCFRGDGFRPAPSCRFVSVVSGGTSAGRERVILSGALIYSTLCRDIRTESLPKCISISSSLLLFYGRVGRGCAITLSKRYTSRLFNKCP